MYIGIITRNGKLTEVVSINANEESVAKRKLAAYQEKLNDKTVETTFVNTVDLKTITKLHY